METVLGLAGMAVFIVSVIALAAAITWTVVKILPAEKPRRGDDAGAKPA